MRGRFTVGDAVEVGRRGKHESPRIHSNRHESIFVFWIRADSSGFVLQQDFSRRGHRDTEGTEQIQFLSLCSLCLCGLCAIWVAGTSPRRANSCFLSLKEAPAAALSAFSA